MINRSGGVLMPVSSLPSPYGIGTFGQSAYDFIDFLAKAGQTYWQILPLGPTGFGNSPYQLLSSYALNPYFIDLDQLIEEGLLTKKDLAKIDFGKNAEKADYGKLYNERTKILQKAAKNLAVLQPSDYLDFLEDEKEWLKDYAVFMAIKNDRQGEPWVKWPEELRNHRSEEVQEEALRLSDEVIFHERVQYLAWKQLDALRAYAKKKGIQIIGDLPFYVSQDSIDVWSDPEQFDVNEEFEMTYVAGFAPDDGNPNGQKWGNPLFNWEYQRSQGYDWWIRRCEHMLRTCDVIRVDHFHGYASCYAVPYEGSPAEGHWVQGPGLEIFRELENRIGQTDLILEDLGLLTPEFIQMVKDSGYPGMKILQYAFDPNDRGSVYMPWQYEHNAVVYTGTHDNNTLIGWQNDKNDKARIANATEYLGLNKEEGFTWGIIRAAYASSANLAIIQMQDFLELDESARTNNPAGSSDNWTWRMKKGAATDALAKKIHDKMILYCRNNWNAVTEE